MHNAKKTENAMLYYLDGFGGGQEWEEGSARVILPAYKCYTIEKEQTQHPPSVLEELRIITEWSDLGNSIILIQDKWMYLLYGFWKVAKAAFPKDPTQDPVQEPVFHECSTLQT